MNTLKKEKQISIASALVEGNSIRSIERMTGVHRDTIMRFGVKAGIQCQAVMNERMRGFHSRRIQADEIWTYVWKKERQLSAIERENYELGDQYVFVAIDADSKLVPSFVVGKRTSNTARQFIDDLYTRIQGNGRIQLTTDGLKAYIGAIELAFGEDVDYAQQIKFYTADNPGPGRYSPPRVREVVSMPIQGNPDARHISTAFVERQNLTMRMSMRRFTRLTNGFSKKLKNLKSAVALHFGHYNFMRVHSTLRVTPAMAAGITDHVWTWDELLG